MSLPHVHDRNSNSFRGVALLLLPWIFIAGATSGCVTVYQPLVSLQRPVVVDHRQTNFEGLKLLVRCVPGDAMPPADAETLCRNVGTLFRNQGAEVDHEVPREGRGSRFDEEEEKPELIMDIRSRLLHDEDSGALSILSGLTFTLIPTIEEQSFAQDVTIRDGSGSLLASDSLQARFVRYYGAGVWGINALLDVLVRPKEDELTGNVASEDFSRDFYGQLSQLMFNARIRSQVLRGFPSPPAPPSPEAPAP